MKVEKEKYYSIAIPREQCYKVSGWCNKNCTTAQRLFSDAYNVFIAGKKELPFIPMGEDNSVKKLFKMTDKQRKAVEEYGNANGWSVSRTITKLVLGYIVSLGTKYEEI